ncbi:hypothetical protein HID58_087197 [Brassica napus]|uniref:Uncharacterized protein n=1 Tax=Brassica napus TaxID=3708 RepID=A0ABQ7XSU4_BRANA|nr:hypothetical protein HID58_087197 [Brassica napus]
MDGSPYRKFSFSQGKGVVPGTGHGILHSGESGCLLAGTQRPVSCLGSGEIQYLSICPNSLPLITRFRHRTRGITCALKSTGVAHSQQASLRQDIAPVMKDPRDRVSDFEVNEVPVHEGLFESERRYHLQPHYGVLPVQGIVKKERKHLPVFDGRWTEKFAFMYLLGFSTVWCTADIPSMDPSLREKMIKQVLELPIERRQVPFLVSRESLECCSIWVMSVKKAAPKRAAQSENEDEVQFLRSSKRQAMTLPASSSKKKSKASGSNPKVSPSSSSNPATVLANLNTKVFPLTPVVLPEGDSSASIQFIQSDLLQAMSQLFHLGERMGDHASLKADQDELISLSMIDGSDYQARRVEEEGLLGVAYCIGGCGIDELWSWTS